MNPTARATSLDRSLCGQFFFGQQGARKRPGRYGWFTEGFDTLDLKEAKALLDDLAEKAPAPKEERTRWPIYPSRDSTLSPQRAEICSPRFCGRRCLAACQRHLCGRNTHIWRRRLRV